MPRGCVAFIFWENFLSHIDKCKYRLYYCISTVIQFKKKLIHKNERGITVSWSFDKHKPVYIQIAERIRSEIITGEYPPQSQIPSVRQLAFMAAVNPNTVQRALTELEDEGIIYSKGTSGRFVTDDLALIENARRKVAQSVVDDFVIQAKRLGITKAEIIRMVEEAKE